MDNIIILLLIIFGLLLLNKPQFMKKIQNLENKVITEARYVGSKVRSKVNQKVKQTQDYVDNYEPTQEDIQEPDYVDKTKTISDFPYPQISRGIKKLSEGKSPFPLNNDSRFQPNGERDLKFIRRTDTPFNMTKQRMYLPEYYRKDRLSGNPSGTEELRKFELDNEKSEQSWTDENVSEHPKFYNADIKNELTNIGSFFDKNNQYNGKTSPNSEALTTDRCYKDKDGNKFCEDNTRLQLIPPSLIQDPQKCYALNSWGMYKDKQLSTDNSDRVINGGVFFDGINPSKEHNETYSRPISQQVGDCAF
tara:strand:+ start:1177 stop:2094 length:918 start_codon:yes stop_codon:yes gene_type:complete